MDNYNDDLSTVLRTNDHWDILKYIRIHKLRESELVLVHGSHLLFTTTGTSGSRSATPPPPPKFSHQYRTKIGYYTIVEQVCLASIDCQQYTIAECCLSELEHQLQLPQSQQQPQRSTNDNNDDELEPIRTVSLSSTSIRYQLLRGRYYEAIGGNDDDDDDNQRSLEQAKQIYTTLLQHNPSNSMTLKRLYCLSKSQPNQEMECIQSLNDYMDTTNTCYANADGGSTFYELYQQYKNIGQYTYAIYCLHHVLYITSSIRNADTIHMSLLHTELAECYVTSIDPITTTTTTSSTTTNNERLEIIRTARKHMSIALELHPVSVRAQFGLVVIANMYLLYAADSVVAESQPQKSGKKNGGKNSGGGGGGETNGDTTLNQWLTHEMNVSKELIRYSCEQIIETTASSTNTKCSMQSSIQALIKEYTEDL